MPIIAGPSNYGVAILIVLAVGILLWSPGLMWNALSDQRRLPTALIPIPGFLYLSTLGLLLWVVHPHRSLLQGMAAVAPGAICFFALILRRVTDRPTARVFGDQGRAVVLLWAALTVGAAALGMNRLPVAQELYANTAIPGRLVASPPDHAIPYLTAAYFFQGYDGRQRSDLYFTADWSVGSRGPLVSFAALSLFHAFHAHPSDPPDLSLKHWPVTSEGVFLARVLGWMTNAFLILGLGHLLRTMGVSERATWIGLTWACLAPSIIQNTVFLWPKALAGFFILLAISAVLRRQWAWSGFWVVLAWLSHPVGLLFAPGVGTFLLWQASADGNSNGSRFKSVLIPAARFAAIFILAASPWLLFKAWLGRHDMFVDYALAAGRVPERAESLAAWLHFRWDSLWFTLVPGAFVYGPPYHVWVTGPLNTIQRWDVQYTKTLPGSLGFAMFIPAYLALFRRGLESSQHAISLCLFWLPLLVMVIFRGFSSDGLGRNSIEPLVPILIAFTVAAPAAYNGLWNLGLMALWLEGRWLELSGMISAQGFTWAAVPASSWVFWSVGAAASLFVLGLGARQRAGGEVNPP